MLQLPLPVRRLSLLWVAVHVGGVHAGTFLVNDLGQPWEISAGRSWGLHSHEDYSFQPVATWQVSFAVTHAFGLCAA
jgi:hypothetical protein